MRRTRNVVGLLLTALTLVAIGVLLGRGWSIAEALDVDLYRWLSDWSRSAGFGGVAAIIAATIAYFAARQNARRQERADRKNQWWARAQWALDLTLRTDDAHAQEVGFDMLSALAKSEWAGEHEGDVIAAATQPALDAEEIGAAPEVDVDMGARPEPDESALRDRPSGEDGPHSEQEEV